LHCYHCHIAISFCSVDERDELKDIQRLIGKTIPVMHEHPFLMSAHVSVAAPVQRQQQPSAFKPRRNSFQSQGAGAGNNARRGYSAQHRGFR